jgi:hypothetical protein
MSLRRASNGEGVLPDAAIFWEIASLTKEQLARNDTDMIIFGS